MINIEKKTMSGKYGPFDAYVATGDTYSVKDQLKKMGFRWYGKQKVWYLSDSKWNESTARQLREMGATILGETQPVSTTPETQPVSTTPEPQKPVNSLDNTEDESQTKWNKFPINSGIRKFDLEFGYKNENTTIPIEIDRWYHEGGDRYNRKKSSKKRGIPRYRIRIGDLSTFYIGAPGKWGTYDEEQELDTIRQKVEESLANDANNKSRRSVETQVDISKRTPEFLDLLSNIKSDCTGYFVDISDAEGYDGRFPVKLEAYTYSDIIYISTEFESPHAPSGRILTTLSITRMRTPEELQAAIDNFLESDEAKNKYLEYLRSFPFLEEEQAQADEKWREVFECVKNPSGMSGFVLDKLVDMGFIRPHRRQRQKPGLSGGEEIKWVMDHKSVTRGPSPSIPEGFYTLVAYLLHRQIKGIESWSEMTLKMDTHTLISKIKKFDPEISIDQLKNALDVLATAARQRWGFKDKRRLQDDFNEFYGDGSGKSQGSPRSQPTQSEDHLLNQLAEMAARFGVDASNVRQNPKKVYRELATRVHPDKFIAEPEKQEEMKRVFQELGNLWDEIKRVYRQSNTWYATAVKYG